MTLWTFLAAVAVVSCVVTFLLALALGRAAAMSDRHHPHDHT